MRNDSIINNIILLCKRVNSSLYITLRIIKNIILLVDDRWLIKSILTMYIQSMYIHVPYFTAEAPTCFDSYNQPRLGGGRLFEHAALNRGSAHPSQLAPCCPVGSVDEGGQMHFCLSFAKIKNNTPANCGIL